MITPKFKLSQSDSELTVIVYAPFARISDADINIEENSFIFYSSPYYLRLTLPGKLVDSEKEVHKATFDADQGAFIVKCVKQIFGEHFTGLDMLTDLLTPKGLDKINKPLIEVLDEDNSIEKDEEEEFDWFYEQNLPQDVLSDGFKYGFANSYSNVFSSLRSELSGLIDIAEPDHKAHTQRRKERLLNEKESFKEEHYLADLFEKEAANPSLQFQPSFHKLQKADVEYTSTEEETLLKLPRKELLIDKGSRRFLYLSLIDILFAWCYNHRITLGENCSESAWNIAKLSSTLSWLDSFYSLKDVVTSVVRRSLIFPLIRNWEFSLLILQDTIQILSLGKKQVLKCLLETHSIFNHYEPYYILNQLYVTDYCIWIQTVKEEKLISLADSLKKVSVSKEEMKLELVELECAAEMVLQEEEEEEEAKKKEAEENLNNMVTSLDQMSVIENVFALNRNDNDGDSIPHQTYIFHLHDEISDSEDSSDDSSDDSDDDDDDDESDTSDSDDDDTDSSSGTSSLDSGDEQLNF